MMVVALGGFADAGEGKGRAGLWGDWTGGRSGAGDVGSVIVRSLYQRVWSIGGRGLSRLFGSSTDDEQATPSSNGFCRFLFRRVLMWDHKTAALEQFNVKTRFKNK